MGAKFNVAIFSIGGCQWEDTGLTINEITASGDALLQNPEAAKDELSAMADLLDEINNAGTDVPLPPPYDELAKSASPPTGGKLKEH